MKRPAVAIPFRTAGGTTFALGPARPAAGPAVLGIRPEDIEDAEFVPGAGPDELLAVTVDLAEPLGAETIVHFDVAPGTPFTARLSPRTTVRAARPIKLAVDVDRLHLFDPTSGQSLR